MGQTAAEGANGDLAGIQRQMFLLPIPHATGATSHS